MGRMVVIVVALPYVGAYRCSAGALIGVGLRAAHSFCGRRFAVTGGRERSNACLRSIGPVDHLGVVAQAALSSVASTW
jgi:hypothetical protein